MAQGVDFGRDSLNSYTEFSSCLDCFQQPPGDRFPDARTDDFSEALAALLGPDAPGLSATTITRLKADWWDDYERRLTRDLERACPKRIRTLVTDYGREFTDCLFGLRKRAATGKHELDSLCSDLGIEHHLAPPQHPQTNGMVENASTVGSRRCCNRTTSARAKNWQLRCTAMWLLTASGSRSQPWPAGRPCRR